MKATYLEGIDYNGDGTSTNFCKLIIKSSKLLESKYTREYGDQIRWQKYWGTYEIQCPHEEKEYEPVAGESYCTCRCTECGADIDDYMSVCEYYAG